MFGLMDSLVEDKRLDNRDIVLYDSSEYESELENLLSKYDVVVLFACNQEISTKKIIGLGSGLGAKVFSYSSEGSCMIFASRDSARIEELTGYLVDRGQSNTVSPV